MSWLDRARMSTARWIAPRKKSGASSTDVSWTMSRDFMLESLRDAAHQPYAQVVAIYRGCSAHAGSASRFALEVFPEGRLNAPPIPKHWLPDLVKSPDGLRQANQLIFATVLYLDLFGESFWVHRDVVRDGAGGKARPHELWLVMPASMTPEVKGGRLVAWKWQADKGPISLSLEQVSFFRNENPYDPIRGLSRIKASLLEYSSDYRAALWNRAFFDNSATPSVVFQAKDKDAVWMDQDREEFIASWNSKTRGAKRGGVTAALPPGVEAQVLKVTQREMMFYDLRRFSREQLLSAIGVPPAIAGVMEYANYANYAAQLKQFHFDTVMPTVEYIESVITTTVLQRYDVGRIAAFKTAPHTADITSEDFQRKVATARSLWDMGVPFREINERLDIGIDVAGLPWLETGWLPSGVTPAEDAGEVVEPAEEDPEDDDAEDEDELDDEKTKGEAERRRTWKGYARKLSGHERRALKDWRGWLRWVEAKSIAGLKQTSPSVVRDGLDSLGVSRQGLSRATPNDLIGAREAVRRMSPSIRASVKDGFTTLVDEVGSSVVFDLADPGVVATLVARSQAIRGASGEALSRVRAAIADGVREGESVAELAARVREVVGEISAGSARTVARTESGAAFSGGRFAASQAVGVKRHQWLSSRDAVVRDSHAAQDGEVVALGEQFSNGLAYPLDPAGDPAEVINCRCVAVPEAAEAGEEQEESAVAALARLWWRARAS